MAHTSATRRCTVQMANGSFCDTKSMKDVPFPICPHHGYKIWRRLSEIVTEAERDDLRILTLGLQVLEEKREREEKRRKSAKPVVYYVLVGDLLKIGTTGHLRQRMLAYPPSKKLLAVEPGSYPLERQRHAEFSDLLHSGKEWFRFEGALVEHVEALRQQAA